MSTVTSSDGTTIAFDQTGQGPPIILVAAAGATRLAEASLAAALAPDFTVFAHDRRGRGESGDTVPYAVEREVDDLDALIEEAGGRAFVFGHSSVTRRHVMTPASSAVQTLMRRNRRNAHRGGPVHLKGKSGSQPPRAT